MKRYFNLTGGNDLFFIDNMYIQVYDVKVFVYTDFEDWLRNENAISESNDSYRRENNECRSKTSKSNH